MQGAKIGYKRVSSEDQNLDRQLEGMQLDRVFIDKVSGKNRSRPEFEEMMRFVRMGDTLYVHNLDRLARNVVDLLTIVRELNEKGVAVIFVKENMIFNGNDSPMSILMLSILGSFAEFERGFNRERQREGIALAKKRGIYVGRKKILNESQVLEIKEKIKLGFRKKAIAKQYGIGLTTLYEYIR